jgi:hypothetical protein
MRMMKHRLTVVVPGRSAANVSSASMKSVIETLGPRPSLTDQSQTGKMRDVYPISILRFENLLTRIGPGKFTEAWMLFSMTLLLNAIRVDTFTRDTRKDLSRQCFYIVRLMMAQKQYRRGMTGILLGRGKRGDTVTLLSERTAIRILNTVLVLLCVGDRVDDIALGRLSSHPVENFFGFVRRSVHDVNTFVQMLTATARSTIVKQGWRGLGLVGHVRTRISNSGVKMFQGEASWPSRQGEGDKRGSPGIDG